MAFSATRLALSVLGAARILHALPQPHGHPTPGKVYPSKPNFTLWLVEEFDTALDLDNDPIWTWSDGGLSEGQVRFVKDAIKFRDGKMVLEASKNSLLSRQPACSKAEVGEVRHKNLLSGEMRTKYNMFRYGYYEVRMKAPTPHSRKPWLNGNYVATMFAYRDAKFRRWREIDVEVTGDSKNSVTMNVLYANNTRMWNSNIQDSKHHIAHGADVRKDFHTYAFEWLPTGIKWFFDDQLMAEHGPNDKLPVPELSTKIVMNLWIFGPSYAFGGRQGYNNRYTMSSEYDWFRFYKYNGDDHYPCNDLTPSCLTEDDQYLSANNPCDGIAQVPAAEAACDVSCQSVRSTNNRVFLP